jgi:hypothetical protein
MNFLIEKPRVFIQITIIIKKIIIYKNNKKLKKHLKELKVNFRVSLSRELIMLNKINKFKKKSGLWKKEVKC